MKLLRMNKCDFIPREVDPREFFKILDGMEENHRKGMKESLKKRVYVGNSKEVFFVKGSFQKKEGSKYEQLKLQL